MSLTGVLFANSAALKVTFDPFSLEDWPRVCKALFANGVWWSRSQGWLVPQEPGYQMHPEPEWWARSAHLCKDIEIGTECTLHSPCFCTRCRNWSPVCLSSEEVTSEPKFRYFKELCVYVDLCLMFVWLVCEQVLQLAPEIQMTK